MNETELLVSLLILSDNFEDFGMKAVEVLYLMCSYLSVADWSLIAILLCESHADYFEALEDSRPDYFDCLDLD